MDYCDRLKQEVAACRSAAEAKRIIAEHRKQLARLDTTMREHLYAELVDLIAEKPV
jgi:hypothetical protein